MLNRLSWLAIVFQASFFFFLLLPILDYVLLDIIVSNKYAKATRTKKIETKRESLPLHGLISFFF
jgi:hypothetical protein